MLPARDKEGFLVDLAAWSPVVAEGLAVEEGINLTDEHWALIHLVRDFYHRYETAPAMRVLVKRARDELGADKGTSLYLLKLFPGSPAKVLARIAGLPRPANCL